MSRIWVLFALAASLALASCSRLRPSVIAASAPDRPNIVFILADDLRYDMLGAAGNPQIHTPNLDALAARSVYFTQAASHIPQCCPARAVMITGLTPQQSGYASIDLQAPGAGEPDSFQRFPTLPSLLRDRGYHTVLVGKWHIKPDPWRSGFAETRTWFAGGMCHYSDPALCRGESRESHTVKGNITEIFSQDAIDFLNSPRASQGPFFLWVAPTAPHEPCGPVPDRIAALYAGKTSKDLVRPGIPLGASKRWDDMWVSYYQAISHLDEQIGRILSALGSTGLDQRTIVVVVSDSGIMMGRRGIDSKVVPYEDSIRIPLLVSAPWITPRRIDAPVSDLDLAPTVLRFDRTMSQTPQSWLGHDLGPAIAGGDTSALEFTVSQWSEGQSPNWGEFSNRTIRTSGAKLIVWERGRDPELYDLSSDGQEERNLFNDPAALGLRRHLLGSLRDWLRHANDTAVDWSVFKSMN